MTLPVTAVNSAFCGSSPHRLIISDKGLCYHHHAIPHSDALVSSVRNDARYETEGGKKRAVSIFERKRQTNKQKPMIATSCTARNIYGVKTHSQAVKRQCSFQLTTSQLGMAPGPHCGVWQLGLSQSSDLPPHTTCYTGSQ